MKIGLSGRPTYHHEGFEHIDRTGKIRDLLLLVVLTVVVVLSSFLTILLVVYLAFGSEGARALLFACGFFAILGFVLLLVQTGANISLRATQSAATVYQRNEIIDAYADQMRNGRFMPPTVVPPQPQAPPVMLSAPTDYTQIQLPQPRESLRF